MKPAKLLVLSVVLLLGAASAQAVPSQKANRAIRALYGPSLVRAEIVSVNGSEITDTRIIRGVIRNVRLRFLIIKGRDGKVVRVRISSRTRITLDGRRVKAKKLRRGMRATTLQNGNARATSVYAFRRKPDRSLSKVKSLLGPNLVRTEVVSFAGGAVVDSRAYIGVIEAYGAGVVTLAQSDGTSKPIKLFDEPEVMIGNQAATADDLSAGMEATVISTMADGGVSCRVWATGSSAEPPKDKPKKKK